MTSSLSEETACDPTRRGIGPEKPRRQPRSLRRAGPADRADGNLISLSTLSITLVEKDIKFAAAASENENGNAGIETEDVEKSRAEAIKAIEEAKGRVIESDLKKFDAGQLAARIVADLPPDAGGLLIDRLKQSGEVARLDIERRQTTPDGGPVPAGVHIEKKETRFTISLYNLADSGFWTSIRQGLATSAAGLLRSLQLIVIGLCFIGPWVVILWIVWKIIRRNRAKAV